MGDIFKEQIVKKQPTAADMLKKIGIIAAAVLLSLLFIATSILGSFGILVVFALAFGVYYLLSFFKAEYEYSFTNGSLDIDVIYDKSRRKRLFTGDVKEFELMARTDNRDKASEFSSAQATIDYSSGNPDSETYAFLARDKDKKVKIIIEPNEMMLKAIMTALPPRKFFR